MWCVVGQAACDVEVQVFYASCLEGSCGMLRIDVCAVLHVKQLVILK